MLGESATHGDGHTEAFKVALVERLVNECGFDSVFFEASQYEFINISRRLRTGELVSADQLSSAVGGLWKFDQEFQPLIPFLLEKAQKGQISLGGIDDQLGMLGQDYANVEMASELTGFLPQLQRRDCALALHRRIFNDYAAASAYSEADRLQINACLDEVQLAVTSGPAAREEQEEMISSFRRWISRDFDSDAKQIMRRDESMFNNFEWARRQQPKRHKIILWAATVHIAKQRDPTWGDRTGMNFGSYVHKKYGGSAFSLGFSAVAGSYRQGRRDIHEMPASPVDSLERKALQGSRLEAAYVGAEQLVAMANLPGAVFRHSYETLRWENFLDGVVVFQEEHPPKSSR